MCEISQQKMHNLPSGQHTATCFSDEQAKTVTAWLGSSESSTYSMIIVPSDIHLFWSLQNSLNGKKISISWKIVKGTWSNSLLKMNKFWKYEWA